MSSAPILNPDAIQALRELSPEGDTEFLRELITIYLEDTPKQIAQFEAALLKPDGPAAVRAAHTMKGSSGNFGASAFADLAKQLEAHAKAGAFEQASALLPALKDHFAQVSAALKQVAGGS